MKSAVLSAVVTSFLLAGCQTAQVFPYPSDWPALEQQQTADDFGALNGWYRDEGENAMRVGHPWSLTGLLFGFKSPWDVAKRVSIQASVESLRVEVWSDNAKLLEHAFTKASGEYSLDQGILFIRTGGKVVGEGYLGHFAATVQLFSPDGLLIAHETSQSSGLEMVVVPTKGSYESWYRFEKLPDTP